MFGCVRVLFAYLVIAVWVCICIGFVASAVRPGKCADHEFWIPGSPGVMILDRDCFMGNLNGCFVFGFWCVFVCFGD